MWKSQGSYRGKEHHAANRNQINQRQSQVLSCASCASCGFFLSLMSAAENTHSAIIVVSLAALIFLGCIVSPPSLMDDVDSVQAQIARNMLQSGDWVTARLNGVAYLEKSPLNYWLIAGSFAIFGVHDWAGRLPLALMVVSLCWLTARFGRWAFEPAAGLYSGLVLSTSIGLFLFTRILLP